MNKFLSLLGMNDRFIKFSTLMLFVICFFYACNLSPESSLIDEGKIVYNVDYLQSEESNPLISLLPNTLEMSFKKNNIYMSVEGWMGIFKSGFLKDKKSGRTMTLIKVMNKKYCYENISDANFMGVTSYTDLQIQFDSTTRNIMGFDCGHALVFVPSQDVSFDVFFTSGLGIDKPNEGTPFSQIPGVLLEFQLEMNGIPMHIKANKLHVLKVNDQVFDVPEDYELVEKQVVDELIASLLE